MHPLQRGVDISHSEGACVPTACNHVADLRKWQKLCSIKSGGAWTRQHDQAPHQASGVASFFISPSAGMRPLSDRHHLDSSPCTIHSSSFPGSDN